MKKFGTHNGPFHADDVMAAAILLLVPEFQGEEIVFVRTRDEEILATCDVVFDVGADYDPTNGKFDHHQRGGAGNRGVGHLPYASAGLVWGWWGAEICGDENVANVVDAELIQPIDAADCGVSLYLGDIWHGSGAKPYSISRAISAMNPTWDDPEQDFDSAFEEAVAYAQAVLLSEIASARAATKAEAMVRKAIEVAESTDPRVIELPQFCPWQDTVVMGAPDALFVIFPAATGDTWMVQCVPPELGSFAQKCPLPEHLAGLRGEELQKATGIDDAVFVHPGRFIGGASSLKGARALVEHGLSEMSVY